MNRKGTAPRRAPIRARHHFQFAKTRSRKDLTKGGRGSSGCTGNLHGSFSKVEKGNIYLRSPLKTRSVSQGGRGTEKEIATQPSKAKKNINE